MDEPAPPAPGFDLVAVAASAGGLTALKGVLGGLPADFPASVAVVMHLDPRHTSFLAEILARATPLGVKEAADGDRLRPGAVLIAPPDRHLVVGPGGSIELTRTVQVHLVRPSADVLFESVARQYGPRAVAVVLTGSGSDGAAGARAVKAAGGTVIAQDRATSEYFSMPHAAILAGCVDSIVPLGGVAPLLVALAAPGVDR